MTTFIDYKKQVLDIPQLNLNANLPDNNVWKLIRGASRTQYFKLPATSNTSTSNIIWNVIPPSTTTVIDRMMLMEFDWSLVFNPLSNNVNIFNAANITATSNAPQVTPADNNIRGLGIMADGYDAPRFLGTTQGCASEHVQINGSDLNCQVFEYADAFFRYNIDSENKLGKLNIFPSMQDCYNTYFSQVMSSQAIYNGPIQNNRNPLGDLGKASYNSEIPRGAFDIKIFAVDNTIVGTNKIRQFNRFGDLQTATPTNPSATPATEAQQTYELRNINVRVEYKTVEPVIISPCIVGDYQKAGLIGVQNLTINLQMKSNFNQYLWSKGFSGYNTTVTFVDNKPVWTIPTATLLNGYDLTIPGFGACSSASLLQAPNLILTYYTPQVNTVDYLLSQSHLYELFKPDYFVSQSTLNNIAGYGMASKVSSQNIQFSSIPLCIYIFCCQRDSDRTIYSTDTYCRFENLFITFNNDTSILNNIQQYSLFELCRENGLKMSYFDFKDQVGNVIKIMGNQLNLGPDGISGKLGNYNFSFSADVYNLSPYAMNLELRVLPVYQGEWIISNEVVLQQIGLSDTSILTNNPEISISNQQFYDMQKENSFYGAGLKDTFKKYGSKVIQYGKAVAPYVKKYGPQAVQLVEKGVEYLAPSCSGYSKDEAMKLINKKGKGMVGGAP